MQIQEITSILSQLSASYLVRVLYNTKSLYNSYIYTINVWLRTMLILISYRSVTQVFQSEDGSTPVRVAMRGPQPSMCSVPRSTYTLHVPLCTKFWNFTILKPYFHYKIRGKSRFNLPGGTYDCEASSHQAKS